MMIEPDSFYLEKEEPVKSCLLALKEIILSHDKEIVSTWKYGMPFFCFRGKMFCYLWVNKKCNQPYIGIVEGKHFDHPNLIQENRSRMKIMLFDPNKDLPIKTINTILKKAIDLYKTGLVNLKE
jgi:hypothetical protein